MPFQEMRDISIKEYLESPADIVESQVQTPQPTAAQYLVDIHACAANFFDTLQIQGRYQNQPPFPWVAGSEFSGIVICIPSDKSASAKFKVGDRVFGAAQGAFATSICANEDQIRLIPENWSLEDAAGLSVTAPTAYAALVTRAGIKAGDIVLVHAAAGGVIATAGSKEKLDVARSFGADDGILYSDPEWPTKVKQLTPNVRGVDTVFDPVGLINQSLGCLAWNGRIAVIGFAAGKIEKVAANRILLKNVSIVGFHWGSYISKDSEAVEDVWLGLERLMAEGTLRPTKFAKHYDGLSSISEALRALGARETWGKVVVTISRETRSRL